MTSERCVGIAFLLLPVSLVSVFVVVAARAIITAIPDWSLLVVPMSVLGTSIIFFVVGMFLPDPPAPELSPTPIAEPTEIKDKGQWVWVKEPEKPEEIENGPRKYDL